MNQIELHGNQAIDKSKELKEVKKDSVNWITYFIDESNGEEWILDYPNSHLHGGGSPRLRKKNKEVEE